MSNVPGNGFGFTCRPRSALAPARDFVVRLYRLPHLAIEAARGDLRESALRRIERSSAARQSSCSRLDRDVMKIEARRLL